MSANGISLKTILTAFLIGAGAYPSLEMLWRGHSHWSMALTGGLCLMLVYISYMILNEITVLKKCVMGSFIITTVEFCVGCVVNIILDWNVWNYSNVPGNIMGQICPIYTILWMLLCLPMAILSHPKLRRFLKIDKQNSS